MATHSASRVPRQSHATLLVVDVQRLGLILLVVDAHQGRELATTRYELSSYLGGFRMVLQSVCGEALDPLGSLEVVDLDARRVLIRSSPVRSNGERRDVAYTGSRLRATPGEPHPGRPHSCQSLLGDRISRIF